jgi:hypothetical protein
LTGIEIHQGENMDWKLRPAHFFGRERVKVILHVACLLAVVLLTGCSKHKQFVAYQDASLVGGKVPADSCAVGGLVMLKRCPMDSFMGVDYLPSELTLEVQSDLWAPVLEEVFEKHTGREVAVNWHDFKNRVPEYTREAILQSTAREIFVLPEFLTECAAVMPEARWILLASINGSEFMSEDLEQYMDQHAETRILWMGLEIYDLHTGASVWSSKVRYEGDGPGDSQDSEQRLDKWGDSGQGGTYVPRNVVTRLLSAPPLRPTMDKCIAELLDPIDDSGRKR